MRRTRTKRHRQPRTEARQHVPMPRARTCDADGDAGGLPATNACSKKLENSAHGPRVCALVQLFVRITNAADEHGNGSGGIETRLWSMRGCFVSMIERQQSLTDGSMLIGFRQAGLPRLRCSCDGRFAERRQGLSISSPPTSTTACRQAAEIIDENAADKPLAISLHSRGELGCHAIFHLP